MRKHLAEATSKRSALRQHPQQCSPFYLDLTEVQPSCFIIIA
jgi:hypothetical protein